MGRFGVKRSRSQIGVGEEDNQNHELPTTKPRLTEDLPKQSSFDTERIFIAPFATDNSLQLQMSLSTVANSECDGDFKSELSILSTRTTSIFEEPSSHKQDLLAQLDQKYVPCKMLFREQQISELMQIIRERIMNNQGENIFISGQPGTGKTASVRHILDNLEKFGVSLLATNEIEVPCDKKVKIIRLNAMNFKTLKSLLLEIINHISPLESNQTYPANVTVAELIQAVVQMVETQIDQSIIIFIDEFDFLFSQKDTALDMIEFYNCSSKLIMISVSNSIMSIVNLTKKLKMKQNFKNIVFEPYTFDQIHQILKDRVNAVEQQSQRVFFESRSLEFCARKLYNIKGGDIRASLEVLSEVASRSISNAIEHAEDSNSKRSIGISEVKSVCDEICDNKFDEIFSALPINQQVLILSIYSHCKSKGSVIVNVRDLQKLYNSYSSSLYLPKAEVNDISDMLALFEDYKIVQSTSSFAKASKTKKHLPFKATEFKALIPQEHLKGCLQDTEVLSKYL